MNFHSAIFLNYHELKISSYINCKVLLTFKDMIIRTVSKKGFQSLLFLKVIVSLQINETIDWEESLCPLSRRQYTLINWRKAINRKYK